MSTAAVKTYGLGRKIYAMARSARLTAIAIRFGDTIPLLVILWGCSSAPSFNTGAVTWKTYSNSRYGFEFLYPSSWTSLPPPENNDGIAFVSPRNNSVEIRGWAGNGLPEIIKDKNAKKTIDANFQTQQGVSGVLEVEVGRQESSMRLTLTKGQVKYYWQGRSPSPEFGDYYRVFYYIAQQYRVPGQEKVTRSQGRQGRQINSKFCFFIPPSAHLPQNDGLEGTQT